MSTKQNNATTIISVASAALLLVVGVGVAIYALTYESAEAAQSSVSQEEPNQHVAHSHTETSKQNHSHAAPATDRSKAAALTIVYTQEGFSSASYKVKSGELVRVQNDSDVSMYFTTGEHHHHDAASPLSVGVLMPGEAGDFTAPEVGVYEFHNHDNPTQAGELIVQ